MVRIHIEVPKEVHRRIKIAAASAEMTLKDYVIAACMEQASRDAQTEIDSLNSSCPECGGQTEIDGHVERCLKCGAELELIEL